MAMVFNRTANFFIFRLYSFKKYELIDHFIDMHWCW